MNTNKLSLKVASLLVLLSTACTSVIPNVDREERQSVVTSNISDEDIEAARLAVESEDFVKAARLLPPLAEQGHPKAQYALGVMYFEGKGVNKDYAEAMKWFRKSAEQGIPEGYSALGGMYADGVGTNKDFTEAAKWFRKAAELGQPFAQEALGTLYGRGDGVAQDFAEAMKWYRKAAEQGLPEGQWRLGAMYLKGEGVTKNYVEAEKWFRKAASQGNPEGQFYLGHLYLSGLGVSKNLSEAGKWFKLATTDEKFRTNALTMWERGYNPSKHNPEEEASLLYVKALVAPPEMLALSYLAVSYHLKLAKLAHFGATVHITEQHKPIIIDASNAKTYITLFEEKLSIYASAIQQRGFQQLATEYMMEVSHGCEALGFAEGKTVFNQDKFALQVAHGFFQEEFKHQGIVVESTLAIENALNPEIKLIGKIQQDRIELEYPPTKCSITLIVEK